MTANDQLTNRPSGWLADWLAGWLAGCEETKVCPFLIFFPLCIIWRYLLDSQDQHVSLGSSALDRNLVNMDDPEGQQKEFAI